MLFGIFVECDVFDELCLMIVFYVVGGLVCCIVMGFG